MAVRTSFPCFCLLYFCLGVSESCNLIPVFSGVNFSILEVVSLVAPFLSSLGVNSSGLEVSESCNLTSFFSGGCWVLFFQS